MPQIDVLHPRDLSAADLSAWSALQAREPAFGSPLLGPEFAQAVGQVRADARVAIWREAGAPIAFLPFHRRAGGFGRPIGAPLSDYHGLVAAPEFALDGAEALSAAGLRAFRVQGLLDPDHRFDPHHLGETQAHRVVLDGDPVLALERLRGRSRNALKNNRRSLRRLAEDVGEVRLCASDTDPAAFERLLGWKSDQLRDSGLHDFLGVDWMRTLLHDLFATRDGPLQGVMINLYAGETLVAGQFGVRLGDWLHSWIAASNPDYRAYSPGTVHQWEAIGAMQDLGLRVYDLGPGGEHWKRTFATEQVELRTGLVTAASPIGRLSAAQERVWSLPGVPRIDAVDRLRRRLDQIAAMELTLGGRVRGVMTALAGLERRTAARRQRSVA